MAEADHPWPEHIHQSFKTAKMQDLHGRDESVYYGPFTRLLYTLFSLDGPYEIMFQFKTEAIEDSWDDTIPVIMVVVNKHPVFFMAINPPSSLLYDSKREETDNQMRRQFQDLRHISAIRTLHGIRAFGTHLSFYEYDSTTSVFQPGQVPQVHSSLFADVAPITRWDCDVHKPGGANRLRDVVKKIKEMVGHV